MWALVVAVLGVGCSHERQVRPGGDRASQVEQTVVSPLTTHVLDARSLSSVNSIEVMQPKLHSGVSPASVSTRDAHLILERIARETMTLKVLAPNSVISSAISRNDRMRADAMLRTEILRFDHRKGSAFGGEPAAVSFRMVLEGAKTGQPVWTAQFFLRQEAVSENLLRLRERVGPSGLGAGWRTAHEVFERGVSSALRSLNVAREQQFLQRGAQGASN